MNRTWLRKMIWSYLPIFCFIFSFLFFVFFQTLVEQNNRNTKESSQVFVNQLLQSVDVSLRSLDNMLIREMVSSKLLTDFFQERGKDNVFLNYQVVNRMLELKQALPIIDSYYLVRNKDGIVFSGTTTKMDAFSDIDFIRSQQQGKMSYTSMWSTFRTYREFSNLQPKEVISLVHNVAITNGADGMIVVNISLASLRNMLGEMYDPERAFVQLYDNGGNPLFHAKGEPDRRRVLASQTSSYTGWTAESGVTNGKTVAAISGISSVWLMLGLLVFVAGGVSIVYITRKNYKPIADLVFRIQDQFGTGKPALGRLAVDEFTFIETAINNFAEQTKVFQQENQRTAARKQKALFRELLSDSGFQEGGHAESGLQESGHAGSGRKEGGYAPSIVSSGLPLHDRLQVFVIEIDHPEHAFGRYKSRDQSLFKFVISSAAHEMFTMHQQMSVWLEWTAPLQLTGILFMTGEDEEAAAAADTAQRLTAWVHAHLAFSVTIGLGEAVEAGSGAGGESGAVAGGMAGRGTREGIGTGAGEGAEVRAGAGAEARVRAGEGAGAEARVRAGEGAGAGAGAEARVRAGEGTGAGTSNRQALTALTFKAALGHNRVIAYKETQQATAKETNKHLQAIHRLIQQLRLHDSDWKDGFDDFFKGMRSCFLPKNEIAGLCRYFVDHLDLQLSQASKEYYDVWMNDTSPPLQQAIEEFDTLDELQLLFGATLARNAEQMALLASHRQHHQLLQEIRDYIGQDYANSELSLEYLGDKFGISAKYISQLFKEEFGENFLDYLSQLRIMEAKKRLLEQPDSIQEVGERVGYVNAATFRRVFRKVEGVSPVDYRKRHAM
ncbi:helix-turn-helix domain-containing protein [Paenibacillus rhizovicinus]|uniref:Helix-turn-helix domain-containing protein n=1 Tax=Paenibacillus rhizovicinus TaxID=2704463 RepID=A0A6C0NXK2_9BACL|nr:helix-turn-helix domain-containing protein [Paenibacillus rhizovicinus]QHW30918.1 helix-turn-helix domain-containing protein [Paenibacillus rhizovicinus]